MSGPQKGTCAESHGAVLQSLAALLLLVLISGVSAVVSTWISRKTRSKKDIKDQNCSVQENASRSVTFGMVKHRTSNGRSSPLELWCWSSWRSRNLRMQLVQLSTLVLKKKTAAKITQKIAKNTKSSKFSNFSKYFFRDITETQRSPAVNEVTEGFNSCWLQRKDPKDKDKTVLDLGQKVFLVFQQNKRWQFFVCQQFSKVLWLWKEVTTFSGFLSFC